MAYDCPMDATTNLTDFLATIGTSISGKVKVYTDPFLALEEFVIAPVADRFGLTGEEVEGHYDTELIFQSVTEYDSINGREGFRLRSDLTEDGYWSAVAAQEL